jgi:hypothetical protein
LEDDHPVVRRPYRFSLSKRDGVKLKWKELLDAKLLELLDGEYACASMMPAKKDVLQNWTEKLMCGDYCPVNRKTKSDRYPMPTPEELFDAVSKARVFSTLDLRSGYHQLPLRFENRVKTTFWRVDDNGRDMFFYWKFLPFGLKNAPAEHQWVMDQVLKELPFFWYYIDNVIIFSDTPKGHVKQL